MEIIQIYTESSLANFTYIIHDFESAYVVDPYDASQVEAYLEGHELKLEAVINTHDHWDHTQGNEALVAGSDCSVITHQNSLGKIPCANKGVQHGHRLQFKKNCYLEIVETPGHTENHICLFLYEQNGLRAVFSGDTLFNAGVGNCRNGGDVEDLHSTICDHFLSLSDEVVVYPGHDYIKNNLRFTLSLEKDNSFASDLLTKLDKLYPDSYCPHLTNIGDEKKINTFFRTNSKQIRQNINMTEASDKEVFIKLRSLRDRW